MKKIMFRAFATLFLVIPMFAQTMVERTFLVRAEIITDDPHSTLMDTCVLVYPDGRYRMEKSFDMVAGTDPRKTKVYLGTLPDSDLRNMETVLNEDKFVQIETARPRKITGRMNALYVTVPREHSVQDLVFNNDFDRKPFEKDLKAFSSALENIERRKVAVAKTEKGNDCSLPVPIRNPN